MGMTDTEDPDLLVDILGKLMHEEVFSLERWRILRGNGYMGLVGRKN
jgi:hypothetical protein